MASRPVQLKAACAVREWRAWRFGGAGHSIGDDHGTAGQFRLARAAGARRRGSSSSALWVGCSVGQLIQFRGGSRVGGSSHEQAGRKGHTLAGLFGQGLGRTRSCVVYIVNGSGYR